MLSTSPSINKTDKIPDLMRFTFSGYQFKGKGTIQWGKAQV